MDLARWLDDLGLADHLPAFEAHEVELADVPALTPDDLREIGLPVGPRRRVLLAAAALDGATTGAGHPTDAHRGGAERRRMSVMFCDLVGSTPMSVRLDVEELRDVLGEYNRVVAAVITSHGGYVAKYLGDGVLAYFGWPRATEDQTERAVRAGLEVTERVAEIETATGPLASRVGIATGEVVVGDMPGERAAVVGRTANLAARLEGVAEAGGVVVDGTTARLTAHAVELGAPVEAALEGLAGPVVTHAVTGVRRTRSRFEAAATISGFTPFVGRAAESARLREAWTRTTDGHGRVVAVGGEAGIGKSRLVHEFLRSVDLDDRRVWRLQCSPAHTASALHPVLRRIEHAAGLHGLEPAARLAQLRAFLADWSDDRDATTQLVAGYLGLVDPTSQRVDPAQRRARMLGLLLERVRQVTASGPLVVVLEDLHWSDPTTLELAQRLARRVTDGPVLVVATHRPGFDAAVLGVDGVWTLPLEPLASDDARTLLRSLLGDDVDDDVVDRLVARTDGNPLYVEELSPLVRGAAGRQLDDEVPVSLAASLTAQIDRLGAARRTAQVAAVIGREFSRGLLAELLGTETVDEALRPLLAAGLVLPTPSAGEELLFKHALVRDAAYETLLLRERRALHARIAEVLTAADDAVAAAPEVIARHWTDAEQWARAAEQWLAAGRRASAGGAVQEARTHLTTALEIVDELDEGTQRDELELEIRLELAPVAMAIGGYATSEVAQHYRRAAELAERVGDPDQAFIARWGVYYVTEIRGQWHESAGNVEQLLAIDPSTLRADLPIQVHHAAATFYAATGQPRLAREHVARALEQYDPVLHADHRLLFSSHDPGVCAMSNRATALAAMGSLSAAAASTDAAVELARALDHPSSIALALWFRSMTLTVIGWLDQARDAVAETVAHTERHALGAIRSSVEITRLETLADREAANQQFAHWLDPMVDKGRSGFLVPHFAAAGAEAAVDVGDVERARRLSAFAEETARRTGEVLSLGKILFQRGRALEAAAAPDRDGAIAAYRAAVDFCSGREMHWLQVEPACALARLLRARGEDARAAAVVTDALAALPEDVDEPRVTMARRLATAG